MLMVDPAVENDPLFFPAQLRAQSNPRSANLQLNIQTDKYRRFFLFLSRSTLFLSTYWID